MKKKPIIFVIILFALSGFAKKPTGFKQPENSRIAYTENKGQVHDQNDKPRLDVLYGTMTGNMAMHIKKTGVSYQLYRVDSWKETEDERSHTKRREIDQQTIYRVDLTWLNANKNPSRTVDETLKGYSNYYLETCPEGALFVKSYNGVTLHNLYNGINLHYYSKNGELKHDYIVAPHANYKQIQIDVKGADLNVKEDGSLVFVTPLGYIEEGAPVVFQKGKQLKARWRIQKHILSFEIEGYDPEHELIIDPITRVWATYYGGTATDVGLSCATDLYGNVYLAGWTTSTTGSAIATVGAHQTTRGGIINQSNADILLVKLDSNGVRQWGTYYGGAGSEEANSCAVDASGNVYITCGTGSTVSAIMSTTGSHQQAYGGGNYDALLAKFNSAGVRQWATFYGGSGVERGFSCAIDGSGNVFMAGIATANVGSAIATVGSHQAIGAGGDDAFLVKFSPTGTRLWGTYYGAAGNDVAYACATDALGNVYFAGTTDATTGTVVITTVSSHQETYGGGNSDGFLVKFNGSGVRLWSTYYGGSGVDGFNGCATDAAGNVYLTGNTSSPTSTLLATVGSHQPTYAGFSDAFLVKFSSAGIRQWGTYYGSVSNDYGSACATDGIGKLYLSGRTGSPTSTAIATPLSHQPAYGGGFNNAYLAIFDLNGVRQWGTYYGASNEQGNGCTADAFGSVYMVGVNATTASSIMSTSDGHQPVYGGGSTDAFLVKFKECDPVNPLTSGTSTFCTGASINLSVSISSTTTPIYTWTGPNTFSATIQSPTISNATTVNVGIYTVTSNNGGCKETATIQVSNADPFISVNNGAICEGKSFTIIATGAATYTYSGGSVVSPSVSTSYSVTGTSAAGCVSSNTAISNIIINPNPTVTANSGVICIGKTFTITPMGANTYTIQGGTSVVSPVISTSYSIVGISMAGCVSANTAVSNVTVNPLPVITLTTTNTLLCVGEEATLTASGAQNYTFSPGGNNSNIIVSPSITTAYLVTGTDANGCSNNAAITVSVAECLGISKMHQTSEINIYPNPVAGKLNIELQSKQTVIIINDLGQVVYSNTLSAGNHNVNVDGFAQGIYLVTIRNGSHTNYWKIIKE